MKQPVRDIPPERRALYYLGMVLLGAGLLLFISNFFIVAENFGKRDNVGLPESVPLEDPNFWEKSQARSKDWWSRVEDRHEEHGRQGRHMIFRALGGMGLMVLGGFLMKVGSHGAAGSGVVLDPEKARRDLEPWSRMGGGMLQDALDEANIAPRTESHPDAPAGTAPVIKVRCRECQRLNDESAKFCNQCGVPL